MFKSVGDVPKPPRRTCMYQYYSHKYFAKRIGKVKMDQLWEAEKAKFTPPGTKCLTRIELMNIVTKEAWERETPEFKAWLTAQRNQEHQIELEKHQERLKEMEKIPDNPESYHKWVEDIVIVGGLELMYHSIKGLWQMQVHSCNRWQILLRKSLALQYQFSWPYQ